MAARWSDPRNLYGMTQWGLDTLFNPAKRHMDEEKRRLQSTREEIGDSSGGKRFDLESCKVTISKTETSAKDEDDTESADAAEPVKAAKPAPSPAAVRAAQRRGRKPRTD
jgi:hypothetical protein